MALHNLIGKIAAKVLTPEKISAVAGDVLQQIIGRGLKETVLRIERTQEGGKDGSHDTDNIAVSRFFVNQGNRRTVQSMEQIFAEILQTIPNVGIDVQKYFDSASEMVRQIFDNSKKYALIGRDTDSGKIQCVFIEIVEVDDMQHNPETGQMERVQEHVIRSDFFITDRLPEWIKAAKDGGYIDAILPGATPDKPEETE